MNTRNHLPEDTSLTGAVVNTLLTYAKTQLLLMVIVSFLTGTLLTVLHVRYSLTLALLSGALSSIPVVGMATAAIIAAGVASFDHSRFIGGAPEILEGLIVAGSYIIINVFSDYVISPFLIGKTTKIHPLAIILTVIMATAILGIAGTLFAVPALLVGKTVWDFKHRTKFNSR